MTRLTPWRPPLPLLAFVLAVCLPAIAAQPELTVAAAADAEPLIRQMVTTYKAVAHGREALGGHGIGLVFGSSGNLTSQIENGAPYDMFLSADTGFARRLVSKGLALPDSFHIYAVGKLVIWMRPESRLDLQQLGAKALLDPSIRKIAIANPRVAPYGSAAVEALKNLGLYDQVAGKLVLGENVSQAAQFVASGNAQAGIIALSLVLASNMKYGHYWTFPQNSYTPLRQAVVILKGTKHPEAGRAFLDFLLRQRDPNLLPRFGFDLPPPEAK